MTDKEIFDLMLECGLMPIEKLEWSVDHYVSADNFIDGDKAAILQFANEIIKREREACADIAENWRCNGMPRIGVAKAIRERLPE